MLQSGLILSLLGNPIAQKENTQALGPSIPHIYISSAVASKLLFLQMTIYFIYVLTKFQEKTVPLLNVIHYHVLIVSLFKSYWSYPQIEKPCHISLYIRIFSVFILTIIPSGGQSRLCILMIHGLATHSWGMVELALPLPTLPQPVHACDPLPLLTVHAGYSS
jgi:hypothetical protein